MGVKIGYSAIRYDITDGKNIELLNSTLEDRIEQEVLKSRFKDKQMLEQSRLAQMGEMISMIAHQWRQPLAAISATSAGVEMKASMGKIDSENIIKPIQNISQYSQHLSNTIDDFRNFFKPNREKQKSTYDEIIYAVLSIVQLSIENQNISISIELNTADKFSIYANELKQVILNLIKNAEDILVEKNIENPTIQIATFAEGDYLILEIRDNGGGISDDIIDKIFDPYFSTKLEKDGTGLGLYMSKTIIQKHCQGELTAFNSEVGAVFRIALKKDSSHTTLEEKNLI